MTTAVACLTPPGTAAIATLAVRGPDAWAVVRRLWQSPKPLPEAPAVGPVWLGRLGGEVADEVVVAVTVAEPVPTVEVHCHGGREVVRALLEALQGCGVAVCSWEDYLRRANDPVKAEAAVALAHCRTARTAAIVLDQHQGAWDRALAELRAAWDRHDRAAVRDLLRTLAERVPLGRHLTEPWKVVVAGAPRPRPTSAGGCSTPLPRPSGPSPSRPTSSSSSTRLTWHRRGTSPRWPTPRGFRPTPARASASCVRPSPSDSSLPHRRREPPCRSPPLWATAWKPPGAASRPGMTPHSNDSSRKSCVSPGKLAKTIRSSRPNPRACRQDWQRLHKEHGRPLR
jgi:hypothetical protein